MPFKYVLLLDTGQTGVGSLVYFKGLGDEINGVVLLHFAHFLKKVGRENGSRKANLKDALHGWVSQVVLVFCHCVDGLLRGELKAAGSGRCCL